MCAHWPFNKTCTVMVDLHEAACGASRWRSRRRVRWHLQVQHCDTQMRTCCCTCAYTFCSAKVDCVDCRGQIPEYRRALQIKSGREGLLCFECCRTPHREGVCMHRSLWLDNATSNRNSGALRSLLAIFRQATLALTAVGVSLFGS